jgi:hypothetical protein
MHATPRRSRLRRSPPTAPDNDLVTLVQKARPIAHEIVIEGFDLTATAERNVPVFIEELIGHNGPPDLDGERLTQFVDATEAAYAIGIAVGLLLRPEIFEKPGGVR